LNTDFSNLISETIRPIDVKLLSLESQCEDLRVAQEQTLEELNKYQDNLENMITQNDVQIRVKLDTLSFDLHRHKEAS
jgi:hypothetical protein